MGIEESLSTVFVPLRRLSYFGYGLLTSLSNLAQFRRGGKKIKIDIL